MFEPLRGLTVVDFRRAVGRAWQALVPRGLGQYGLGTLAFERLPVGV